MCSYINDQLLIVKKFPLLLPQNKQYTVYNGFISAGKDDFQILLEVPNYPSLIGMTLHSTWELGYILHDKEKDLDEWTKSFSSLCLYLESLQTLIASCLKAKPLPLNHNDCVSMETFKRIMSDLESVGMEHCTFLSNDLTRVKLKAVDESQHCHIIQIELDSSYPHQPIQIQADLPQQVILSIKENTTLISIYRSFVQHISSLQAIWSMLDSLDAECWVLDPEHPTRKDMNRRIVIDTNVSVHLTFDPNDAVAKPSMKFLGPERTVMVLRQHLADNLEEWDADSNLLDNLKCVLGITSFPPRLEKEAQNACELVREGECCICYAQRLEGELPTEVCENEHCGCAFHECCLFLWLQTVPGNYQSFNRIHGDCPNCNMAISCPVPD